ncbi:dTMP kinase [candidate division KSB1 bacterium 4484_87]|nr:MAG: dTMP kinase [candidate division KSB1 bacterium 4484_87]
MNKSGYLITFEGIDGCGKSVQVQRLTEKLDEKGFEYILLREPGGTLISEKIREVLLTKAEEPMTPLAEFLLFSAARAQLTNYTILPALKEGKIIILDRFFDSSTAYQGYGRGIDPDFIQRVNRMATSGTDPDLTFFLDIDLEEMKKRRKKSGKALDRMEDQALEFFNRVREGYQELARANSERFYIIDGKKSIDEISREIWQEIEQRILSAASPTKKN